MLRHIHISANCRYVITLVSLAALMSLQIALLCARPSLGLGGATTLHNLDLSKLPLPFEPNAGQADSGSHYLTHTPAGTFSFGQSEVVIALRHPVNGSETSVRSRTTEAGVQPKGRVPAKPSELDVVRLQFVGANSTPNIVGGEELPGAVSYFRGNDPSKWEVGLPTYGSITYKALYYGIDLRYNGTGAQLKGTYTVAPGADASLIRWRYSGVQTPTVDQQGNLTIVAQTATRNPQSAITEAAPVAWQQMGSEKRLVEARYAIAADGSISFALGAYDRTQPLVIDPTLSYSSYLGNSFADGIYDIAVDSGGNIYVTGANQSGPSQLGDLSVYKINADASAILYTAYLVGNDSDVGYGIAVDATGSAYITGESYSTDFPLVNAFQSFNCNATRASDAVVVKLNPAGSSIIYSTYLGGCGGETGRGIAVDASGSAYVTGETGSTDFPTQNPFQGMRAGPKDVFVTKFAPSGNALAYSTYLGGGAQNDIVEYGWAIKVDGAGSAYVTGYTSETDFPLHNPIQANNAGFGDSFLTKFAPSGTSLVYSTYLGGALNDIANDVALDAAGDAYVVGWTESDNFPTVNPYQTTNNGYEDIFVTEVNPAGNSWLYSTYLGGIGRDGQYDVNLEVAPDQSMIVAGDTQSSDFPVGNWIQQFHANPTYPDIFVTRIAPSGASLIYSTFLGGNVPDSFVGYPIDVAYGTALDAKASVYITGQTNSPNWPIAGEPFQPTYSGGAYDGLVAKIDPDPAGPPVPPAPTPGPCATADYEISQSTGNIVPGTSDVGNHCDLTGCTTGINLTFPFTLYDRTFTSAYLGSAGTIGFLGNQGYAISRCLPLDDPQNLNFGILGYWDYIETDGNCTGGPCGIYTSISGIAPNRVFNVEWRARKYRSFQNYDPVNFEIRLHENSSTFEVIYGAVSEAGAPAVVGVQRDTGSRYTQYACQTAGSISPGLKLTYTLPCGPGFTPTARPSPTHSQSTPTLTRTAAATDTQPPAPSNTRTPSPASSPQATASPTATPQPTCGPTWARVGSPDPNPGLSFLYGLEVISPDNIWAVGKYQDGFGADWGLTLHWNGNSWSQAPGPGVRFSVLTSVSAVSSNDIWAVGYYNPDEFSVFQPLTVHWNGNSWSIVSSPANPQAETTLQGVAAVASNDAWAVGENENGPLIMHWDGASWIITPHPLSAKERHGAALVPPSSPENKPLQPRSSTPRHDVPELYWDSFYAVEAVSANDVWAMGALGDNSLAMHWDGTAWEQVNTPNPYSTVILRGITAVSSSDIWAVGSTDFYMGQPSPVTIHWDGQSWANVPPPAGDLVLFDVAAESPGNIWAVGYQRIDDYHTGAAIVHRTGSQWTRVPGPNPASPTIDELYSVAVFAPQAAWAVGTFDGETLIDRYSSGCGTPASTVTATPTATATSTQVRSPVATVTSTATRCPVIFSDVHTTDYFYEPVAYLYCAGVISGYSDSTFRPFNDTTRGQLSKIVVLAEGWSIDTSGGPHFTDVQPSNPFYDYIETAYNHGIISGYTDNTFRWSNNVTRAQLSKIVVSAQGWMIDTTGGPHFTDVPASQPFYTYIETAFHHTIVSGYADGTFFPGNNATRGQIAKIIYAAITTP